MALCPFLLLACNRIDDSHKQVLDEIERQATLPHKALPISKYSRYYTEEPNGTISAVYVVHDANAVRDTQIYCANTRSTEFPCGPKPGHLGLVDAGSRKWVSRVSELPMVHGGGCGVIRFEYDVGRRVFSNMRCNPDY